MSYKVKNARSLLGNQGRYPMTDQQKEKELSYRLDYAT